MTITMQNNTRAPTIPEMKKLVHASKHLTFKAANKKEIYTWIEQLLVGTDYHRLRKKHRTTVIRYIRTMTGYSKAQTNRLIAKWKKTDQLRVKQYRRHSFPRTYSDTDVVWLARADKAHENLSGPATAKILRGEWQVFGRREFENLTNISPAHIYNLRETWRYRETNRTFQKTKPAQV